MGWLVSVTKGTTTLLLDAACLRARRFAKAMWVEGVSLEVGDIKVAATLDSLLLPKQGQPDKPDPTPEEQSSLDLHSSRSSGAAKPMGRGGSEAAAVAQFLALLPSQVTSGGANTDMVVCFVP